jgi:hypothetical protein
MRERPIAEAVGVKAVMDSVKTAAPNATQPKDVMDSSLIEEIVRSGYIGSYTGNEHNGLSIQIPLVNCL